jgi:hypothetical protein
MAKVGETEEISGLAAVFTEAAEDALAERLSVLANMTESDKIWAAIAHPLGGRDVERRAVAAMESSQLLRPLLNHGAAGGILTLGRGGTNITAHNVASGVVADSLREALLIEANIERSGLETTVRRNLRRLVATAREHTYPTWMVMGVDVSMQPGLTLRLPWGCLLSPLIRARGLEMSARPLVAVRVSLRSWLHRAKVDQRYVLAEAQADRAFLLLGVSVALAFDDVMPPVQRWRAIVGPGPNSMELWSTPSHSVHGEGISADNVPEVEGWASRLEVLHDSRLDIAAERLSRARAERNSWEDQLIDAVIAWENVCGGSTETTFRVTASLAKLIEQQPAADREKLLDTLGTVYAVPQRTGPRTEARTPRDRFGRRNRYGGGSPRAPLALSRPGRPHRLVFRPTCPSASGARTLVLGKCQ